MLCDVVSMVAALGGDWKQQRGLDKPSTRSSATVAVVPFHVHSLPWTMYDSTLYTTLRGLAAGDPGGIRWCCGTAAVVHEPLQTQALLHLNL
jgi:hypothetical protein